MTIGHGPEGLPVERPMLPEESASESALRSGLPRSAIAGLTACIAVLRAQTPSGREPWVRPSEHGACLPPGPEWSLAALLHLGRPVRAGAIADSVSAVLERHGLVTRRGDRLEPGWWEVTAHRGVLAVRDRARGGPRSVYLGEDGLTFLEAVLDARPGGDVLEVGSGSGLVSAGAARTARRVTAVDIVPACLQATSLTAWLNGVADRVVNRPADLTSDDFLPAFANSYDCVVANLPGVPVPPGLAYSPAGNGGPDGLRLIRRLLDCAPGLLRPAARGVDPQAAGPALLMRFQSLGTDVDCFLLPDIQAWASKHGFDAMVTYTSRAPVEVRNGLTAIYALPLNPGAEAAVILDILDAHAGELGATHFYSATLVARCGSGAVHVVDAAPTPLLDVQLHVNKTAVAGLPRVIDYRFLSRLWHLPEGFWEMGSLSDVDQVVTSAPMLLGLLAAGCTPREALRHLHPSHVNEQPATRSRLSATTLLVSTLLAAGLVQPLAPAAPTQRAAAEQPRTWRPS